MFSLEGKTIVVHATDDWKAKERELREINPTFGNITLLACDTSQDGADELIRMFEEDNRHFATDEADGPGCDIKMALRKVFMEGAVAQRSGEKTAVPSDDDLMGHLLVVATHKGLLESPLKDIIFSLMQQAWTLGGQFSEAHPEIDVMGF